MVRRVAATAEELKFASLETLAELVRSRQVHPRELVEGSLRQIEEVDGRLNAFRVVLAEEALAAAEEMAGSDGPLAGVPVAIKDEMPVAGQVCTMGSRTYGQPAAEDSEVVRKLRGAGAIPIGITNVPELTIWPWTASDANGITRNPFDLSRTPGGSSGGSAAAVAAGVVAGATGSDGGGSIRIPAACCGLVGMKPTRGRVSLGPDREHWLGLTAYGPLARTTADSALLLDVMQGNVAGDADVLPRFAGSYREAAAVVPGKLRIAMSKKIPFGSTGRLSADQRGAWEATASLLSELGHEVIERDPAYRTASLQFIGLWERGIYEDTRQVPEPEKLEPLTRQLAKLGRLQVSDRRAERLRRGARATAARLLELWEEVDVLITPGLASTAIAAEAGYGRSLMAAFNLAGYTPWTPPFNVTGQPAMTIPAGLGGDGLPLSVQLVGGLGAEETLYALGGQIEAARPWADLRPAMA
jgi:amidase